MASNLGLKVRGKSVNERKIQKKTKNFIWLEKKFQKHFIENMPDFRRTLNSCRVSPAAFIMLVYPFFAIAIKHPVHLKQDHFVTVSPSGQILKLVIRPTRFRPYNKRQKQLDKEVYYNTVRINKETGQVSRQAVAVVNDMLKQHKTTSSAILFLLGKTLSALTYERCVAVDWPKSPCHFSIKWIYHLVVTRTKFMSCHRSSPFIFISFCVDAASHRCCCHSVQTHAEYRCLASKPHGSVGYSFVTSLVFVCVLFVYCQRYSVSIYSSQNQMYIRVLVLYTDTNTCAVTQFSLNSLCVRI